MGQWRGLVGRAVFVAALAGLAAAPSAEAACGSPGNNEIVVENCRPGNPASEWDVAGAGDPGIQGFATDISVAQGGTVRFKVDTTASDYRLDIYRMGYYGGAGARLVATVQPSVALPQSQPACDEDASDRPDRLRELGAVRLLGGAGRTPPRASTSPSSCVRAGSRAPATSSSWSVTTTAPPTCSSRRPTRRGRPTTTTAATASTPATRRGGPTRSPTTAPSPRARTPTRTGSSTASIRWSAGSSATATTSATRPVWTATASAPNCASTQPSSRSDTTSTGPGPSATTWRPRATRA